MNNTRYPYSPIVRREPLRWPNGARVAVWVIPNIEHFHIDKPGTATRPASVNQVPDVYNHAWRDYGLRVGIWRIMGMFDKYGIRGTVALNAEVCEHYPEVVEEGVKRGWEYMGHGLTNSESMYGLEEAAERDVIERTLGMIEKATGKKPRGWLGPGLAETMNTPDLLAAAGVEYVGDWCADDQPFPLTVASGSLVAMPYSNEINDIPLALNHHFSGQQIYETNRDQFDVIYQDGQDTARVMGIALHPFITGVPHRAKYLDQALAYISGHRHVWLTTGSEILDAYRGATGGVR
jgi:peptidoglycan/xylan/chitin deacetylase (PgdA/CDA1 family)